MGLIIPVAL